MMMVADLGRVCFAFFVPVAGMLSLLSTIFSTAWRAAGKPGQPATPREPGVAEDRGECSRFRGFALRIARRGAARRDRHRFRRRRQGWRDLWARAPAPPWRERELFRAAYFRRKAC